MPIIEADAAGLIYPVAASAECPRRSAILRDGMTENRTPAGAFSRRPDPARPITVVFCLQSVAASVTGHAVCSTTAHVADDDACAASPVISIVDDDEVSTISVGDVMRAGLPSGRDGAEASCASA